MCEPMVRKVHHTECKANDDVASKHREIRHPSSCDHAHYFISQLYEQDWEPRGSTGE